jgi:hypothetical protein
MDQFGEKKGALINSIIVIIVRKSEWFDCLSDVLWVTLSSGSGCSKFIKVGYKIERVNVFNNSKNSYFCI